MKDHINEDLLPGIGKETLINTAFPAEGCYFDENDDLRDFLIRNNYQEKHIQRIEKSKFLKWKEFNFWYINDYSINTKNYTSQHIKQLINSNINKNEVLSIETENRRPAFGGAAGIRCRRQQGSVGSRPKGNEACIIKIRAKIIVSKISKTAVKLINS